MAKTYSLNHATMRNTPCNDSDFADGITNGGNFEM